jgi:hypothetical protein
MSNSNAHREHYLDKHIEHCILLSFHFFIPIASLEFDSTQGLAQEHPGIFAKNIDDNTRFAAGQFNNSSTAPCAQVVEIKRLILIYMCPTKWAGFLPC